MIYYLDTSIWIDVYEKRGRNGEIALSLFNKIIIEESMVLLSDAIIFEFKHLGYGKEEIISILGILPYEKIQRVETSEKQMNEAKNVASSKMIPKRDAVHAILCRDNCAQLISRDAHFHKLRYISIAKPPEYFI